MREPQIKVDVADLTIGMYIVEIDRPWLESPFLFQGFPLHTDADLEEVRNVCEYVYVDPEKSEPDVRAKLRGLASKSSRPKQQYDFHDFSNFRSLRPTVHEL